MHSTHFDWLLHSDEKYCYKKKSNTNNTCSEKKKLVRGILSVFILSIICLTRTPVTSPFPHPSFLCTPKPNTVGNKKQLILRYLIWNVFPSKQYLQELVLFQVSCKLKNSSYVASYFCVQFIIRMQSTLI